MQVRWDRTKGRPEPIAALNKVAEIERGDPLVDMREFCPSVVIHRDTAIPFCRKKVAEMAEQAARSLPTDCRLGLTDAWRPIIRQITIYEWFAACVEEAFPHLDYAQRRRKTNRMVAPFNQKAPPGHCTGAALDVVLLDPGGEPYDVTAPFDRFSACATYTYGLTEEAQRYRTILVDAMLGAGFSNCRDEWWHYSYGDAGWAIRMGLNECEYGLVEMPEEVYAEYQVRWLEAFKDRKNPYLNPS